MELLNKNYKYLKIKTYIKTLNLFLIYNGTNTKEFIKVNQKLKTLNLCYTKPYNSLAKKALQDSIFTNSQSLLNNHVILIKPEKKRVTLKFEKLLKLDESFYLTGLKINNKIYPASKINIFLQLNYKKDHLFLVKFLKNCLKVTYHLN